MKFLSALAVGLILAGSVSAEEVALECQTVEDCSLDGRDCFANNTSKAFLLFYENDELTRVEDPFGCETEEVLISDTSISVFCTTSHILETSAYFAYRATINRFTSEFDFYSWLDPFVSDGRRSRGQCSVAERQF